MTLKEITALAQSEYCLVRLDWIYNELRNIEFADPCEVAGRKHKARKLTREIKDYIDKEVK